MQVDAIAADRRQHPRTLSHTEAMVSTRRGIFHYTVSNLSVAGALLVDGPPLMEGDHIEITLRLPLYPEFRVPARVVHVRGDRDDVALGDVVEQAQLIGRSGNTGRSTGPHLHYELHLAGIPIDPLATLPMPKVVLGPMARREHLAFLRQLEATHDRRRHQ